MSLISRRQYVKAGGVAGVLGLSGCLSSITGGGETPTLTMGWIAPTSLPSLMTVPEIEENLDNIGDSYELELVQNQSTPDGLNKLAAGELDITSAAYSSFGNAVNNDILESDVNIVGTIGYDAHADWFAIPWLALSENGYESATDLEGGNVGLNGLGTGVHAIAAKVFADNDMTAGEDFEYVEIPFPAMQSAIAEGRVDAGTIPPAFGAGIQANLDVNTVFDGRTAFGGEYPFVFNVAASANIEENTAAFEGYGADYVQTHLYAKENRQELVPAVASHFELPEGLINAFWFREGRDWYIPDDTHVDGARLQAVIDELPDLGFIESTVDVEPRLRNDLMG